MEIMIKRQEFCLVAVLLALSIGLFESREALAESGERYSIQTVLIEPFSQRRNIDAEEGKEIDRKFREILNLDSFLTVLSADSAQKAEAVMSGSLGRSQKGLSISVMIRDSISRLPVATESIVVSGRSEKDVHDGLVNLVLAIGSRLPAKGELTEVTNSQIGVGAGGVQGLEKGATLGIFRIKKVVRHPFTQEIVSYDKVAVASAIVTSVAEESSTAKIVQSVMAIQKGDLVTFEFSRETAKLFRAARAETTIPKSERPLQDKSAAEKPKAKESLSPQPFFRSADGLEKGWAEMGWVYLLNRYHL